MIHGFRRAAAVATLGLLAAGAPVSADIVTDNVSSLDEEFAKGYLEPINDGMNASMNSGIFRTADIPLAGLNVSLDFTTAVIKFGDDAKKWSPDVPAGFESGEVPTVVGDTHAAILENPDNGAQLAFPGGVDLNSWGYVAPQITVGSILGTRAMVRWLSFTIGDEDIGDVKLWGIGGQHSVSQYFPGLPFHLALGAMYQSVELGDKLIDADGLALAVTASRSFGKVISIQPYVGAGLDSFKMKAQYDLTDSSGNPVQRIEVDYDRKNTGRFTLGASLNMPIVKAFGELNFAAHNGYAAGLSLGF